MNFFQIIDGNISNFDAIISFIDFTDDIPTLVDLLKELGTYENVNIFQKRSILNYIKDRISVIQEAQRQSDDSISNSNTSGYGGKVKSLLPAGQRPRSREYIPTEDGDRGYIGQKAAFIATILLLAGIGLTVVMYALLAYAQIIK